MISMFWILKRFGFSNVNVYSSVIIIYFDGLLVAIFYAFIVG